MRYEAINLADKLASFREAWAPRISPRQYELIAILEAAGQPMTIGEIAAELGLADTGGSFKPRLIQPLIDLGIVELAGPSRNPYYYRLRRRE